VFSRRHYYVQTGRHCFNVKQRERKMFWHECKKGKEEDNKCAEGIKEKNKSQFHALIRAQTYVSKFMQTILNITTLCTLLHLVICHL
jgi:hypothetical protein